MNILLTGAAGQLGQELLPRLQMLGKVTQVDRTAAPGSVPALVQNLDDLGRVEILLNRMRPDIIVNAAAYTAVDFAEDHSGTAFRINAEMPGCIARWSERNERLLIHYSTDYVFDGNASRPYAEQDSAGPLGVYGESKLAGELAIAASKCRHVILRTSWVYSGHGNNFVLTMLRLARERPLLNIVSDQVGCPTWARNLAVVTQKVIAKMIAAEGHNLPGGIYHYCDGDAVSWYQFARAIFEAAMRAGILQRLPDMKAVRSVDFPQKARRPLYSVLDTSRIEEVFGITLAGLDQSLQACVGEMATNEKH
jgi:dTDP-4-dehydrorhamnose reductase